MTDLYDRLVSGIKEHQAPSCLEEQRLRIEEEWKQGEGETSHRVSESEAVGMAIAHNHVQYIEYLLQKSPVAAMRTAGYSCSHLARAVETDRPVIIRKLLRHTLKLPPSDDYAQSGVSHRRDRFKTKGKKNSMAGYLNKPSGCMLSGPSKTAVHLACEMGRAACLRELLHHGAIPTPKDSSGLTPVDHSLRKLCSRNNKNASPVDIALALKELIPFLPTVQADPETVELVRKTAKEPGISTELGSLLQWILGEFGAPRSLHQLCRHRIRSEIGRAGIEPVPFGVFQLPLPKLIQRYLYAPI